MTKPHRMHYEGKQLNENLTPLKRFLRAQVGRPWDKVYSEINEHVKVKNTVQAHIRQHIDNFIAIKTHRDDFGQVWDLTPRYQPLLLSKGDLYVEDGIVKLLKNQAKIKYDRGCKVYAIYKYRVGKVKKDAFTKNLYFDVQYFMVETKKMGDLGVSTDTVVRYYRAASYTEALKVFNSDYRTKDSFYNREYIQVSKPKKA